MSDTTIQPPGIDKPENFILAHYQMPKQLVPDFHTAMYILIVGAEQGHPPQNLKQYAKRLRELADHAFIQYER